MKTKQEQIDEIEKVVGHNCNKQGIAKHCPERISNGIYNAGYRKASDVIDAFESRLSKSLACQTGKFGLADLQYVIAEMRQEVEK